MISEREPKPSHLSTASGADVRTVLSLIATGRWETMVEAATSRGFSPEVFLFPQMMTENSARNLKILLEKDRLPPFAFHLPNRSSWEPEDLLTAIDCLGNRDLAGVFNYLPTRLLVSPKGASDYCRLIDQFTGVFSQKDCQVITAHDCTIVERDNHNGLRLNPVGEKLASLAKQGYKVGIELVFEGDTPPVACPTPGHLDTFLEFCARHQFGLTLDTHNLWVFVGRNGGTLENFPGFFEKFIHFAQKSKVPIYMVHFNPSDLSSCDCHLAPQDSPFSFQWLRKQLVETGLDSTPVSLEISSNSLKELDRLGFTPTPAQLLVERIIETK